MRPPKSAQRTPTSRHTWTAVPEALPSSVPASTVPSPVTTTAAARARSRNPIRPSTSSAPETSSAPSAANAAPRPPAAPAPGTSATGRRLRRTARRASSSSTCLRVAPFCGPKARAAPRGPRSGFRTSQAARTGTGKPPSTCISPAPPSTVAESPRQTSSSSGCASSAAWISSPRPRLEARMGSSSSAPSRARPIASAASRTAVPSGRSSQRAVMGRPKGSDTVASCHDPPRARASTSAVPPPPSAIGRASARAPAPSTNAAAASTAERTPLRLPGDARSFMRALALRPPVLPTGQLGLSDLRHLAQHRERQAFASEEEESHADADRGLDRLQPDPEREPLRIRDSVLHERERDRGLREPDVPGPEREDGRDVHQHEDEARGGQRDVDVEPAHGRVDGEELAEPAEALEEDRPERGKRLVHHAEAVARHRHDTLERARLLEHRAVMPARHHERDEEKHGPNGHDRDQAGERPAWNLGRRQHVGDEQERGDDVEDTVGKHRPYECRPPAVLRRRLARQDRDARELADPPRQDGIRQQPYTEGREHEREARSRRRHRLVDDDLPRDAPRHDRQQVERDGRGDPVPLDGAECIGDGAPIRPAPPEQDADDRADGDDRADADPRAARDAELHAATCS